MLGSNVYDLRLVYNALDDSDQSSLSPFATLIGLRFAASHRQ